MWNSIKERFRQSTLRAKLILAFACIIVIPFVIIGGTLSWLYMDSNQSMIVDAAVENNKQIIRNIETSLHPILRLSMYPVQDKTLLQMMHKDYTALPYPLYERELDYDTAGAIVKNNMLLYSDLIDSIVIYQTKNRIIIGRSNDDYMNHHYLENGFSDELFFKAIINKNGEYMAVGVHPDKLMSPNAKPIVSIGRAIVDPYSREVLGLILLNISVDKLKTLWGDIPFTEHTSFYLVDDYHRIIYSKNKNEIGQPAADVIGDNYVQVSEDQPETRQNRDHFMIVSTSGVTNWKAVTIIPKNELFSFVNTIVRTITISLLVLLGLSILTSIYIATSITRPLLNLHKKMKLVAQGNLDVTIDIQQGEVGKISITIDNMLQEIRRLIAKIYREEQDKRKLELLALQSQIKPHFMYNTLNAIKWMAKIQGASGIEEALTAFSSVIRFTAKAEDDFVTVAEEAAFIRDYTKILEFRYFNKFDVDFDFDSQVASCYTLKFLLQPLIENAVFHGFDGIAYKGHLSVRIHQEAGSLIMTVSDNGRGMEQTTQELASIGHSANELNSIGVKNIRKRIKLHFGDSYGLDITSKPGDGTVATVVVPIIRNREEVNTNENRHRG